MKAEHRHQLQTNALADRMGRVLQGMKSSPKSTSTLIWVFVLLALATSAVWQYAASATMRDRSNLWTRVNEATHGPAADVGKLQAIEVEDPGTIPARAARFQLARLNLQQGMAALAGDDRVRALPLLSEARNLYTELVPHCEDVVLLAQEALMGRATAEESLAAIVPAADTTGTSAPENPEPSPEEKRVGSLDKAAEYYAELARKYPESILGKRAAVRAKELQDPPARERIEHLYAEGNKKAAPKATLPIKVN